MNFFDIINVPMGAVLNYIYGVVESYGLAIILFTIIIKLLLFPFSINQQKTMVKTARIQPKLKELEKKYKGDKNKYSEEMMKLYQKEGINPAGGCLPLLIQLPFMFGLYWVISQPLTYLYQFSKETIDTLVTALTNLGIENLNVSSQISIVEEMTVHAAQLPEQFQNLMILDFNFFGINLSQIPSFTLSPLLLIPFLAGASAFLSSYVTSKIGPTANMNGNSSMQSVMYMMPLMSIMICFSLPAGVGLYWIISSLMMVLQQFVLNFLFPPNGPARIPEKKKEEKPVKGWTLND